jgi:hypothetical protein
MSKKKTIKLTKRVLTTCSECGRPKFKDDRRISEEQMALIDENLPPHKTEGITLR